ncbi:hypothetical protein ACISK3_09100 [Morganella morganii]
MSKHTPHHPDLSSIKIGMIVQIPMTSRTNPDTDDILNMKVKGMDEHVIAGEFISRESGYTDEKDRLTSPFREDTVLFVKEIVISWCDGQ